MQGKHMRLCLKCLLRVINHLREPSVRHFVPCVSSADRLFVNRISNCPISLDASNFHCTQSKDPWQNILRIAGDRVYRDQLASLHPRPPPHPLKKKKKKKKKKRNVDIPRKSGFPTAPWNQENISSADYSTYVVCFNNFYDIRYESRVD